jgi:hypothetical protein
VDEHTISPAGDPFIPAPRDHEAPHACWDGYVYIGHAVEADGEEVEEISTYPCRRCTSGPS